MLFADFINWAMEQADLTNYKLAKRIGVSQTTIANWASGTTEPRDRRRAEVLDLFGVDEHDLETGFPDIHYKEVQGQEAKKESPPQGGEPMRPEWYGELTPDEREQVRRYAEFLIAERRKDQP